LVNEIRKLKKEIEELKVSVNVDDSEKQSKLQVKLEKLEKAKNITQIQNKNRDNYFPVV